MDAVMRPLSSFWGQWKMVENLRHCAFCYENKEIEPCQTGWIPIAYLTASYLISVTFAICNCLLSSPVAPWHSRQTFPMMNSYCLMLLLFCKGNHIHSSSLMAKTSVEEVSYRPSSLSCWKELQVLQSLPSDHQASPANSQSSFRQFFISKGSTVITSSLHEWFNFIKTEMTNNKPSL